MSIDPRLDPHLRQWGADLEAAYRKKGTPLPEGVSGEDLLRSALEEMEREALSPVGRERAKRIKELAEHVAAELPGGTQNPEFPDRLMKRMQKFFEADDSGPAASA
jgi:hypothetical protein